MAARRIFPRVAGLAVVAQASPLSSAPSQFFWLISNASLHTSQSAREAGKLELSRRAGVPAEIGPTEFGSDDRRGKYGLPPLTRPGLLTLVGGTGKNTESQSPGTICVFISLKFVVIVGLVYTWLRSCKRGLAVAVPAGA
jgi:hypothetical protein